MDVHFSFDKPGWRIKTTLKQNHCCEGSRRPTRPGRVSLVTFFARAKKVTRQKAKKKFADHD